jgi:threonine aldolase
MTRGFASDNCSGIHPEVLDAIVAANVGHQPSYGDDVVTERLDSILRSHFGEHAVGFPVFNGTGSNLVALRVMTGRWASVLCSEDAHIATDEGGAPEQLAGLKLVDQPAAGARLVPDQIEEFAGVLGGKHWAQPSVVSLTQPTEWGVVYSIDELRALCETAHRHGLLVHMDGARLYNAAVTLGVGLGAITTDVGVDVLSLGGTKAGLMGAEAVVVLNPRLAEGEFARKSTAQLASKQRFLSAQLEALLAGDLWQRIARHGNDLARYLAAHIDHRPGLRLAHPVETNAVFLQLDAAIAERLSRDVSIQIGEPAVATIRLMMSFDLDERDIDDLLAVLDRELAAL